MAVALISSFEGRLPSVEYAGRVLENAATGGRGRLEVGTMRRLNMGEEVTGDGGRADALTIRF